MGNIQEIISALIGNKGQQISAPQGQWQGNGVFMNEGRASIPAGSVADRLMSGQFGPAPDNTAPQGFRIPEIVSAILNGGGGRQAAPQAQQQQVAPQQQFVNMSNENGVPYGILPGGERVDLRGRDPNSYQYGPLNPWAGIGGA